MGDYVMEDSMFGRRQVEGGSDQLGSTPEEFGVFAGLGTGSHFNVADIEGDFFEDAFDDRELFRADQTFVA